MVASSPSAGSVLAPLRVLLVENDNAIGNSLGNVLVHDRCLVARAHDGEEGLELYRRTRPHILLVDALLPRLSGIDLAKQVRALAGEQVAIVLMSSSFRTARAGAAAMQEACADAFVSKPFVLSELRKKVLELGARFPREMPAKPPKVVDGGGASLPPALSDASAPSPERVAPVIDPAPVLTPGASSAFVEPPPTPLHTQPPPPTVIDRDFTDREAVRGALFAVARQRRTGVLRVCDKGSQLEVAFLRGVLVGARDNLRESQLGERLLRAGHVTPLQLKEAQDRMESSGERIAEALVSIGAIDAVGVLRHIEEQVHDRVARALGWAAGSLRFVDDEETVRTMAVESYDLVETVMRATLSRKDDARAFLLLRGRETFARTVDFDDGLIGFARLAPRSALPGVLMAQETTLDEVARQVPDAAAGIYALWSAGLLCLEGDGPPEDRRVPRPLRSGEGGLVDAAAVSKVAAVVLRARGRTLYQALGVPHDAPAVVVKAAIDELDQAVGQVALQGAQLGPARGAARELWTLLDDARRVLLDDVARAGYDQSLQSTPTRARPSMAPEQEFLDGQISLSLGDVTAALGAFARAREQRKNDPDIDAYFAWAQLLAGDDVAGLGLLSDVAEAHPQAMRPRFFLGLAAARGGQLTIAREHLAEAARRSPHDVEVRRALQALLARQAPQS